MTDVARSMPKDERWRERDAKSDATPAALLAGLGATYAREPSPHCGIACWCMARHVRQQHHSDSQHGAGHPAQPRPPPPPNIYSRGVADQVKSEDAERGHGLVKDTADFRISAERGLSRLVRRRRRFPTAPEYIPTLSMPTDPRHV